VKKLITLFLFIILLGAGLLFAIPKNQFSLDANSPPPDTANQRVQAKITQRPRPALALISDSAILTTALPPLEPPAEIKAVYVTSQTAANHYLIENIVNLINNTELNAVVIDIKDSNQVYLTNWMARLVRRLRDQGIYPIARQVIFQDNFLAKARPDLALKKTDGSPWGGQPDRLWVDPASQEVWDYNAEIASRSLALGFAEINFDYIRFPEGNSTEISYPFFDKETQLKTTIIKKASDYIVSKIKEKRPAAIISIDVFAYSFLRDDGLGIGQNIVELTDHFDVIAPMIYPSHYASGNFGFANPAAEPYQVTRQTLLAGLVQLNQAGKKAVIRPWLQDFNLGAVYDRQKVQEQIKAVKDAGLTTGYMMWNPNNIYLAEKYR